MFKISSGTSWAHEHHLCGLLFIYSLSKNYFIFIILKKTIHRIIAADLPGSIFLFQIKEKTLLCGIDHGFCFTSA